MSRPLFVSFASILGLALAVGCAPLVSEAPTPAAQLAGTPAPQAAARPRDGRVGTHGMVLFGAPGGAYLSHIPMFHKPHDVQLIVAGAFETGSLPTTFSDALYTFEPEPLSLDALRLGRLETLTGVVYRGNFEQGGVPVAADVRFRVDHVVHQHELPLRPPGASSAPAPGASYLVLGRPEEAFVVHRIATAPGFDQILRVAITSGLGAEDLAVGAIVTSPDVATLETRFDPLASLVTADGAPVTFTVQAELSCLVGPGFDAPCP